MSSTPILEGNGVRLEPLAEEHIETLQAIALDPTIWRYMPLRIETAGDVGAWARVGMLAASRDTAQVWITRLASGEIVGSSQLSDLSLRHRTGEIGSSWLTAPYRGSGVNPRIKLLQLTHAFETLGLRRVALKTHHENLQSQRNILKLGAQYEGTFRNHLLMPDGSTRHTVWYSILDDEWPAVKQRLLQRIAAQPLPTRA